MRTSWVEGLKTGGAEEQCWKAIKYRSQVTEEAKQKRPEKKTPIQIPTIICSHLTPQQPGHGTPECPGGDWKG